MRNYEGSDGRFPDDSLVEVRYPRSKREEQGDQSALPVTAGLSHRAVRPG